MRKTLSLAAAFAVFTISAIAQNSIPKIQLLATGFVGPDSTQNYVVIEAPKLSKSELYKKTLTHLNGLYKNPSAVLNTVEGESIVINGSTEAIKGNLDWYRYPMTYNIKLMFKDGKIRFEPVVVELNEIWSENKPPRRLYLNTSESPNQVEVNTIYMRDKSGNGYWLFKKDLKQSIDKWVNNYAAEIVKSFNDSW